MYFVCLKRKNGGRGRGLNEKGAKMEKGFYINLIKEKEKKKRKREKGKKNEGKNDEDGVRDGQRDAWLHSIRNWHAKLYMCQLEITQTMHAKESSFLLVMLQERGKRSFILYLRLFCFFVLFHTAGSLWCYGAELAT